MPIDLEQIYVSGKIVQIQNKCANWISTQPYVC